MNETVRKTLQKLISDMEEDYNASKFDQDDGEGNTINDANNLLLGYIRQLETIISMSDCTTSPSTSIVAKDERRGAGVVGSNDYSH